MDRVERRSFNLVSGTVEDDFLGKVIQHLLCNFFGCLGPDVDDLVITFTVGNQTLGVLVLDFRDLFFRLADDCRFSFRDNHVVQTD